MDEQPLVGCARQHIDAGPSLSNEPLHELPKLQNIYSVFTPKRLEDLWVDVGRWTLRDGVGDDGLVAIEALDVGGK